MVSIEYRLTIALQKAHFGDYSTAILQLIEVIQQQQKQIEYLLKKETNNG